MKEHNIPESNWKVLRWKSIKGFLIRSKKLLSWICSWTWNDRIANTIHFGRSFYATSSLLSTWSRGAWSTCDKSHINCFLFFKPLSPIFIRFLAFFEVWIESGEDLKFHGEKQWWTIDIKYLRFFLWEIYIFWLSKSKLVDLKLSPQTNFATLGEDIREFKSSIYYEFSFMFRQSKVLR